MDRALFCIYWLYFAVIRVIIGDEWRVLDYLAMSLIVFGLMRLIAKKLLNLRLVVWVTILLSPLFIADILHPGADSFLFFIKTYTVAIFFSCYFKVMRITKIELTCFMIPVVVALFFFINPEAISGQYQREGRFAGLWDPNFTAQYLILSLCSAIGLYQSTTIGRRVKKAVILVALACSFGVLLTASRAGFIGLLIALCLILVMSQRIRYANVIAVAAIASAGTNLISTFTGSLAIFDRLTTTLGLADPVSGAINERYYTEMAWYQVQAGEWFIGGSPTVASEYSKSFSASVGTPHNSLLDIGIAFGKASFYCYAALLVALLVVNVWVVAANWRCRNAQEKSALLTPMIFLSLLPMYMTLSAGLAMDFILWIVLGAYPLLHAAPTLAEASSEEGL
jgi:O-antigen ligase